MTRISLARTFWISAAGILILAALIAISALLRSNFTETDGHILLTLLALLVSSGTAVAGLTLVERHGHAALGWGAVAVAVASFIVISMATWNDYDDESLWKLGATAAIALIATLLGTTQLVLNRGGLTAVVAGTWLVLGLAVVSTTIGIWDEAGEDSLWKAAAMFWILGLLGWLLLPVLQRFTAAGAAPGDARVLASIDDVELVAIRSAQGIDVSLAPGERLVLRRRA